ncbi:Rrf2 family transcriptional regulator [Pseudenhygromyxa sp. WMMC2535]|uniref:Rrf2 family transcriptional regulator n=1 Tax=Pseudenhygromyxa sp. WMMC2535 TaxID=2712867 RepID=UPI0015550F34|nr:Rrf2 family transcriptional regulator [Pseudenhygromyxa sp. WMMC2535]NVB41821.1 Rrf2 family transcriptional regulator [Pseudenhygromyxa sp. WMMC2535]
MNTQLAVAVHILTLLDAQAGEPTSSEWIAGSVNTNPALIRRLLSRLNKAGLTRSQRGAGGGSSLARPAAEISLADVYAAVADDAEVIPMHGATNPKCPVGHHIQGVLQRRFDAAEQALRDALGQTSIADLTRDIGTQAASG